MRNELVDNMYETALDVDDKDSFGGIKLAPAVQFTLGLIGIEVSASSEDLFEIVENTRNLSTFKSMLSEYDVECTLKNDEDHDLGRKPSPSSNRILKTSGFSIHKE